MKPAHKTILNNHQQNQELIQLRDWLLPMLMNGQVTVG
jgi:type I restriction enzyme S subunit